MLGAETMLPRMQPQQALHQLAAACLASLVQILCVFVALLWSQARSDTD
jgi:hypothetical protein